MCDIATLQHTLRHAGRVDVRFWKRKRNRKRNAETTFEKIHSEAFPGGEEQIEFETHELMGLLEQSLSKEYVRETLIFAKGRAIIGLKSTDNVDELVDRCTSSIVGRSRNRVDRSKAATVAAFAVRKLTECSIAPPTDLTKEEALTIARVTAFRLARHRGRTDVEVQEFYNVDPASCIAAYMPHFLWAGKRKGPPRKVESRQDAIALSLDVAQTLALTYYVENFGKPSIADSEEIEGLAKLEWKRTLELVRNKDSVAQFSEYDPSEARAAHDMQVPFDVVLKLGEVGLLKDPPSPTKERRKVIADAIKGIQNVGDYRAK